MYQRLRMGPLAAIAPIISAIAGVAGTIGMVASAGGRSGRDEERMQKQNQTADNIASSLSSGPVGSSTLGSNTTGGLGFGSNTTRSMTGVSPSGMSRPPRTPQPGIGGF